MSDSVMSVNTSAGGGGDRKSKNSSCGGMTPKWALLCTEPPLSTVPGAAPARPVRAAGVRPWAAGIASRPAGPGQRGGAFFLVPDRINRLASEPPVCRSHGGVSRTKTAP